MGWPLSPTCCPGITPLREQGPSLSGFGAPQRLNSDQPREGGSWQATQIKRILDRSAKPRIAEMTSLSTMNSANTLTSWNDVEDVAAPPERVSEVGLNGPTVC